MKEPMRFYVLRDGEPVAITNMADFALSFEESQRRIALTVMGNVTVSTVFLGIDHNFSEDGPPILFETMVFGGRYDDYQERYCTKAEALAGHERTVELVRPWFSKLIRRLFRV